SALGLVATAANAQVATDPARVKERETCGPVRVVRGEERIISLSSDAIQASDRVALSFMARQPLDSATVRPAYLVEFRVSGHDPAPLPDTLRVRLNGEDPSAL